MTELRALVEIVLATFSIDILAYNSIWHATDASNNCRQPTWMDKSFHFNLPHSPHIPLNIIFSIHPCLALNNVMCVSIVIPFHYQSVVFVIDSIGFCSFN